MIEYIYYGYLKEIRPMMFRKWKDFRKIDWVLMALIFVPALMIPISTYIFQNWIMSLIFLVILIVVGTSITVYFERDKSIHYIDYLKCYNHRLDKLREVLKQEDVSAYSEITIQGLVEQCNEKLPTMNKTKSFLEPLSSVFNSVLLPLISIGVAVYLNSIETEEMLNFLGAIVMFIAIALVVYYSTIVPIFGFINRKQVIMKELKFMLIDIIIYDFRKLP